MRLFARLRLISVGPATRAVLFSTVIFLAGGVIGTFHHLYFTGVPSVVLALGSVFSALEEGEPGIHPGPGSQPSAAE
ncbi:hypothetical protein [Sorangium sp. So ce1097]|uniref:hypothetical protein n=1 Tax=Sorangium sp. So ce1097 TaxID=3133330 RepID=UPI003F6217C6